MVHCHPLRRIILYKCIRLLRYLSRHKMIYSLACKAKRHVVNVIPDSSPPSYLVFILATIIVLHQNFSILSFLLLMFNKSPIVQASSDTTHVGSIKVSLIPKYKIAVTNIYTLTRYLTTLPQAKVPDIVTIATSPRFTSYIFRNNQYSRCKDGSRKTLNRNVATITTRAYVRFLALYYK